MWVRSLGVSFYTGRAMVSDVDRVAEISGDLEPSCRRMLLLKQEPDNLVDIYTLQLQVAYRPCHFTVLKTRLQQRFYPGGCSYIVGLDIT